MSTIVVFHTWECVLKMSLFCVLFWALKVDSGLWGFFLWLKALDKYNVEKDIAAYIKKEFDKKYNPTWHCIVGRNFGKFLKAPKKQRVHIHIRQLV